MEKKAKAKDCLVEGFKLRQHGNLTKVIPLVLSALAASHLS
jgi:hypothetical protein